jgi:hypothetical protein
MDTQHMNHMKGGEIMTSQTYSDMLEELKEQKKSITETINTSQQIIQQHEQTIKEAQQKLIELENGMQFISKWFLHETDTQSEKQDETESVNIDFATTLSLSLEDTVKDLLDKRVGSFFRARQVAEILEEKSYPTTAKRFVDVVANALRSLSREEKIGYKKTGKYVKYYSLADQGGRRKILYDKAEN